MYHHLQSSFNGGELSPRLQSRVDIDIHAKGAAEILNMVPTVEGALLKRSGTRYRAAALSTASWISAFVFNATQAYVIEWSDGKLRFLTNNAILQSLGSPVEVTVPYSAAEAPRVSTQQSKDRLYMAHGSHPHASLLRTAADAFTYAPLDLKGGPFADDNIDEAITVTASAVTGTGVTITASAAIFEAGHVGSRFRMEAEDFAAIPVWETGIAGYAVDDIVRFESKVYIADQISTDGRSGQQPPIHPRGSEWDGSNSGNDINDIGPFGVRWRYLHDRFGILKITAFIDSTHVTATVERRLPTSVTSVPTYRWAHSLFSAVAGWPEHVTLWGGRLWFFQGFELAGSVSGGYLDHSEYNEDGEVTPDMAIRKTLDIPDAPLWVVADRQGMLIGTTLGEYVINKINPSEVLSADNIQVLPQGRRGSAPVWPLPTAEQIMFLQRGGRKIRAAAYNFTDDRYLAPNNTIYARHITGSGIKQLTYQAEPEELLWALRNDGKVAAHPYNPEQDVKGWCQGLVMEGAAVESAVSIPSTDGSRDDLYLLVNRGGSLSHEQLADWWDENLGLTSIDGFFVDSGLEYDGAPATVFSGLDHLADQEVMVLADGAELPLQTVTSDGIVTLDNAASRVVIGKAYTARFTSLRPEIPQRDGTSQNRIIRIVRAVASVLDSFGLSAGSAGGLLDRLIKRSASDNMGDPPSMYSGWTVDIPVSGNSDTTGQVTFESRSPFPWLLRASKTTVTIGDK